MLYLLKSPTSRALLLHYCGSHQKPDEDMLSCRRNVHGETLTNFSAVPSLKSSENMSITYSLLAVVAEISHLVKYFYIWTLL
jgi:hypothetical protein